jgi:hypothetical protein
MHTRSMLVFAIPADCRRFEALVGLDDNGGRLGRSKIKVLLDDQPVDIGKTGELSGRDEPVPISLNIAGKRKITLMADFGRFGDVQGHVNWVNARLLRNP